MNSISGSVLETEQLCKSHVLRLTARLLVLGVIKNFSFTWVDFRHDDGCKTLRTLSSLDCFCNCEAVVHGNIYSFNEYVQQAGLMQ